ncbi:hypothetical protein [Streptococcus dysgalactiae]|uniref:Hypothetical membrane spanning protein n=1 Tax=Streptococcus dysgalactiae subsp. dysgalactiae TaxID=99822 RepID=A0A380JXK1_STRDY|nr:hypothetical protein [Streptococcus dysgalactiae]MCB2828675.1 hypothetical protein [Streptococcus dysgalactiae subsp. dysgalactiae]MCB2831199.1 hypothetical protein [Streptococcus dysgalactiae subsp. dysgalactiae]MCB2834872.1 hypothetical protein [Streptococcus dysgalactiae subsp. dysgalactiae]MCB2836370.1 hypothetical protein [Streptococcus dysgalactiae subsp. dysgalactiae]MCB2838389.1 hypothetical protein [Streptococcus dysgalactiae subsp. dysgalactiae]
MLDSKQNLVKSQWGFIVITAVMDLVVIVATLLATISFQRYLFGGAAVILTSCLILLVWGLKTAKKLQTRLDSKEVLDSKVRDNQKLPKYDERQKQILLKGYTIGFWFMIVVVWLSLFISRFTEGLVSASFLFTLALWGGLAVQTTYCNLNGASPFVDRRFGKQGVLMGMIATGMSLVVIGLAVREMMTGPLKMGNFFKVGGSGSLMVLGITLLSMGASILYRHYLDAKEADE